VFLKGGIFFPQLNAPSEPKVIWHIFYHHFTLKTYLKPLKKSL
jgi:hypothetical protein